MVAGGATPATPGPSPSDSVPSTETLVEGGQVWIIQQPLPNELYGLVGVSLPDTVIMTG